MLATIRNLTFRKAGALALFSSVLILGSCKTNNPAPLIADPRGAQETALPWNEQQKWEREGEGAALNQQRRY
ncbi:MAG TPA: hypothetical protein VM940_15465 [Chthoniobacterales bacterium]|jgi:hypothetical protein|nr:hypothetical protein [Chthoniobacterales bacterium]